MFKNVREHDQGHHIQSCFETHRTHMWIYFGWFLGVTIVFGMLGCGGCPDCARVRFRINPQLRPEQSCLRNPFAKESNKTHLHVLQITFMLPDQHYWVVSAEQMERAKELSKRPSGRTNFFCERQGRQEACLCLSEAQSGVAQMIPCVNIPLRRLVNGMNALGGFVESELQKRSLEFEVLSSASTTELILFPPNLKPLFEREEDPLRRIEERLLEPRALSEISFEIEGEWLRLTSEAAGLLTERVASFRVKEGQTVRFLRGSTQQPPVFDLEWLPCK
ncbi:MAG: hypothetical protein AAGJ35_07985 [Myxococcota bacterium]